MIIINDFFLKNYLNMSYRIVTSVPEGSRWLGDGKAFIQEGCIKAWGYQEPYGKNAIVARYLTPKGEHVIIEKYVLSRITEAEARASLRAAGY